MPPAGGLRVRVRIRGAREIVDAFDDLPAQAQDVVRDLSHELATDLATKVTAEGVSQGPQTARAARSVKVKRDRFPILTAGGTAKARAVLFGSEFGATRKFGWYRRARYYSSTGRQFRPHRGSASYWLFATVEREQPEIERTYEQMAERIIRQWAQ